MLNDSTDSISCEVQDNLNVQHRYLADKISYLSLQDPYHNARNGRQQRLTGGGKTQSIIGRYIFDPWLLMTYGGVVQELVLVVDFASDALELKLASSKLVKALLVCDMIWE